MRMTDKFSKQNIERLLNQTLTDEEYKEIVGEALNKLLRDKNNEQYN